MNLLKYLNIITVILSGIPTTFLFTFDRNLTGIHLDPYFKPDDLIEKPDARSYTVTDIEAMVRVVSTRFSRILTYISGPFHAPYMRNASYYYFNVGGTRTAEIAASINRKYNYRFLTVLIGIFGREQAKIKISLAMEAFKIADSIYPGTVEGICYIHNDEEDIQWAKETLNFVKTIRNSSPNNTYRVGIFQECDLPWLENLTDTDSKKLLAVKKEILLISDFTVCNGITHKKTFWKDPLDGFYRLQFHFLERNLYVKSINKNIEVMFYTLMWKKESEEKRSDISKLRNYASYVNQFAKENRLTVWLGTAFGDRFDRITGWWKLRQYANLNNVSAYIEKVTGLHVDPEKLLTEEKIFKKTETLPTNTIVPTDGELNKTFWRYAGIITAIFAVISVIGLLFLIYKKWEILRDRLLKSPAAEDIGPAGLKKSTDHEMITLNSVNVAALKLPYNKVLEIPKENVKLTNEMVGSGAYGHVFKAILLSETGNEKDVALKIAKKNSTAAKCLLSEIKILNYLGNHPNIVPMLGAYTAEINSSIVYMATEFFTLGSLKNWLLQISESTQTCCQTQDDFVRWMFEISRGMEYVEEKGIVHADLSARNIFLSSNKHAKIGDFGLSSYIPKNTVYIDSSKDHLPWRWMAYEVLKSAEFSTQSDVWSYGVLLWEIFSYGALPYPGISWTKDFIDALEDGFRLTRPKHATKEIFELMNSCWAIEKEERPTFAQLKHLIFDLQASRSGDLCTHVPHTL